MESLFWIMAFLVIYHHILYPLILTKVSSGLNRQPKEPTSANKDEPQNIDILMPAYNEAEFIQSKLANLSCLDSTRRKLTIHIGLDGCTDSTFEVLETELSDPMYQDLDFRIYNFGQNRGKIAVLNDLMTHSTSDIVLLTDTSALLPIDCLEQLDVCFADSKIGAVSLGYTFYDAASDGEASYWQYQTRIKQAESHMNSVLGAHGAGYALRRELYTPLSTDVINDDFIIPMSIIRQGYRVLYCESHAAVELEHASDNQNFNRRKRISKGNFQQLILCLDLLSPRYGYVAFNFFSGKALRSLMPIFLALLFVMSFVMGLNSEFYLLLFGIQSMAYCGAFVMLALNRPPKHKLLSIPYYIITGHLASLFGMLAYLHKDSGKPWQKV